MKKALFFIQNGVGGAERVQLEIAKMLINVHWEVQICKVCYYNTINDVSIDSHYPTGIISSTIVYRSHFSLIRKLYLTIKKYHPDIVFCSVMNLSRPLLSIKPIIGNIKFIVRCNNYLYTLSKFKRLITILCYHLADKIISQTEEMEDELCRVGIQRQKVKTLHNPLNKEDILHKASQCEAFRLSGNINYIAVGRFAYQKGFDILVKAFRIVLNKIPEAYLTIVGNYDYDESKVYEELKQIITKDNTQSHINFTGQLLNPYPLMKKADVFVLSSRWEGLPNTLIETQLLGTPAAATKCIPIISRIIKEGSNGWLCEPESVEDLAQCMIKAAKLGRIEMTYEPARSDDFIKIFEDLYKSQEKI